MAQFDLKFATIKFRDGTSVVGAAGAVASIGGTSLTVTGFSKAIAVGMPLTITGDPTEYFVTGSTGGTTPTAIAITPPLVMAVTLDQVITLGPNLLIVRIGDGNLQFTEKVEIKYIKDRGLLYDVMYGDQMPLDVSLDFRWEFLSSPSGATVPTPVEALKNIGPASTWISSDVADPCRPYCVDLEILYVPPCAGVDSESIILPTYRYESLDFNPKEATVSTKGQCNTIMAEISRGIPYAGPVEGII
jgi:hypothetical protein